MSADETPQDGPGDDTNLYLLPVIGPELQGVSDKDEALFAGLTSAEALVAVATFTIDAKGESHLRQRPRLVPQDPDRLSLAEGDREDVGSDGPTAVVESEGGTSYPRDIDLLSQADRDRGEQIMERVDLELARRRAEREAGVVDLSRERFLRWRRRGGLYGPD